MTLPGCLTACPLSQFVRLTKKLIPENWDRECSLDVTLERYEYESEVTTVVGKKTLFLNYILVFNFHFPFPS